MCILAKKPVSDITLTCFLHLIVSLCACETLEICGLFPVKSPLGKRVYRRGNPRVSPSLVPSQYPCNLTETDPMSLEAVSSILTSALSLALSRGARPLVFVTGRLLLVSPAVRRLRVRRGPRRELVGDGSRNPAEDPVAESLDICLGLGVGK